MADPHESIRAYWDVDAETYDHAAAHGVTDPVEAAAWRAFLHMVLPPAPARVLDVGAGTGSLSLLAAELGHRVTALDLSEVMLSKARAKAEARGLDLTFVQGPAQVPPAGPFDVVMERHVLWTILEPVGALKAWRGVVRSGGLLLLIEGIFDRGGPIERARAEATRIVRRALRESEHDHHAPYPRDVLEALPLQRVRSPEPLVRAVLEAGWTRARLTRLRDVEWAQCLREHPLVGWLEHHPRFAVVAEA
jgi:SAM-dependent methyltransferase